jgi:hypothetical protein
MEEFLASMVPTPTGFTRFRVRLSGRDGSPIHVAARADIASGGVSALAEGGGPSSSVEFRLERSTDGVDWVSSGLTR